LLEDHWFEPRPYRMPRNRSRQSRETFGRGSFLLFFCQVN
jgi:hypothetical protein